MKILITGSNGLLGQKLINKLKSDSFFSLIATSKGQNRVKNRKGYKYFNLDITDNFAVSNIIFDLQPDVVINTAAMTNVDLCEDQKEKCDDLNFNAVGYLANACLNVNAHLIHISTDFVFDGKSGPYREDDVPNPLSYYGISKLKSEQLLLQHNVQSTVLRTIILFGVAEGLTKSNIVLWAKSALKKGEEINIIDDQFRAPTLAEDLADACIFAAMKKVTGIYHVSGKDIMSIYDIVERTAKYFGYSCNKLNKINTNDLNQKAERPKKTGFILEKAISHLNYNPHSFEESLSIIEQQLKKQL